MSWQLLAWIIGLLFLAFAMWDGWRRWRLAAANPSRTSLPRLIVIFLFCGVGSLTVHLVFCAGSVVNMGITILFARPGFGTLHRGDPVMFESPEGSLVRIVVGLPADRLEVRGNSLRVNGLPSPAITWPLHETAQACPEQTVGPGQLAIVRLHASGGCDLVQMIPAAGIEGHGLLTLSPLTRFGRIRWPDPPPPEMKSGM